MPGCKIGEISAEQMSTAVMDELDVGSQGVFSLPMGMGKVYRCMGEGSIRAKGLCHHKHEPVCVSYHALDLVSHRSPHPCSGLRS